MIQSSSQVRLSAVQIALQYISSEHPPKDTDLLTVAKEIEDYLVGADKTAYRLQQATEADGL